MEAPVPCFFFFQFFAQLLLAVIDEVCGGAAPAL